MSESPPVSLVLLAYRQEAYVEAAVRSAFAQNYDNLEIVLSDDRSPDGTFAAIERVAAGYDGPHRVVTSQTGANGGVLAHLYDAVARANGELLVIAAGDDLSYPDRVSVLVDQWRRTGADALYSRYDVIDEGGATIQRDAPLAPGDYHPRRYFPGREVDQIFGGGAAYSREVFERIALPGNGHLPEDYFFSLMLALCGRRVAFVDRALIAYRAHGGSTTHAVAGKMAVAEMERLVARSSATVAPVLRLVEHAAVTGEGIRPPWQPDQPIDLVRIREDIGFHEFRSRWLESSVAERLRMILAFPTADRLRWLAPRLFGLPGLKMVKGVRRLIRPS